MSQPEKSEFKSETVQEMIARKQRLALKLEELLELLRNEADYSKINCAAAILVAFSLEDERSALEQAMLTFKG